MKAFHFWRLEPGTVLLHRSGEPSVTVKEVTENGVLIEGTPGMYLTHPESVGRDMWYIY